MNTSIEHAPNNNKKKTIATGYNVYEKKLNLQRSERYMDGKLETALPGHCSIQTTECSFATAQQDPIEPQREKTYLLTCAPNEVSDQPVHSRTLILVFVLRMKKLCILGYLKCAK